MIGLLLERPLSLALLLTLFSVPAASRRRPSTIEAQARDSERKEHLVWEDNFKPASGRRPDPAVWSYDEGGNGWGNGELEVYCAYGSSKPPCDPQQPNSFVGDDSFLHIVARKTPDGRYTSARLTTHKLKSFQYGRIEARIRVTAGQGLWPAFWLMGENIDSVKWPGCGEIDVMENIGKLPGAIYGSVHGKGFTGVSISTATQLPGAAPFSAAFHTFGIIWKPQSIAFYVDDPSKPYIVYTPKDLPRGAVWTFDDGPEFLLLNLAVGGGWPGPPEGSTRFPAEMLVDSVKVWELPQ